MTVTTEAAAAADANDSTPATDAAAPTETPTAPLVPDDAETGGVTVDEIAAVLGRGKVDISNVTPAEEVDAPEEEPDVTPPAPVEEPEVVEPVAPPAPTPPAPEAPADAPDFSLEVEDAEGVTHKIERIEDLPEDFEPKNNRQIMEVLDNLRTKQADRASYEADQAQAAADAEKQTAIEYIQRSWNDEVKALQAAKRIPMTADPNKNERVDAIYKFMGEENERRIAKNMPPLETIEDVLDKLERQEANAAAATKLTEAKETARKNGALVGGSSAPGGGTVPVYKSGSARNAGEAMRVMGII